MDVLKTFGARQIWMRLATMLALCAALGFLLVRRLQGQDPAQILGHLAAISPVNCGISLAATLISFWAIGRFEALAHRHMRTGVPDATAARVGRAAVGLGQVMGLGFLTIPLIRWRCLPDVPIGRVVRFSLFATFAFMAPLAVLAGTAIALTQPAMGWLLPVAVLATIGTLATGFLYPEARLGKARFKLPTLPALCGFFAWSALDLIAAALALYVLLPAPPPFATIFAAFLVALFLGQVSGAPGGILALDLAFIALLPGADVTAVLAALLGFRLVYYALPGLWGLWVAFGPRAVCPASSDPPEVFTGTPARAEQWLMAGGDTTFLRAETSWGCALRTPQTLSLYLGTLSGDLPPLLDRLRRAALSENRVPLLYRVDAADAALARKQGWWHLPIAEEALLDPARFDLAGPGRRQLRRHLRKAAAAGVTVQQVRDLPPVRELTRINAAWVAHHGAEKGVTMGRYAPSSVMAQRIFVARVDGRAVAFITLHYTAREWTLDLMRHLPDLPTGTMHSLIAQAIGAARDQGVSRLSLTTAPLGPVWATRSSEGLRRFKASFAPEWQPRYLCAPGPLSLLLGGLDLLKAVHSGNPLSKPHERHEDYEFASPLGMWDVAHSNGMGQTAGDRDDQSPYRSSRVA